MLRPTTRALLAMITALGLFAAPAALLLGGCAGATLSPDTQPKRYDGDIEPDGPLPWFRDAGCGSGLSGASGQPCPCGGTSGASGASGQPCDGGAPDVMPADTTTPKPDVCVAPAQWSCDVTLSFAQVGSESTGGVHGDFNGPSPTPWVTKPMALTAGRWTVTLALEHGSQLNYKFVIDLGLGGEQWFHDASNPKKVPDSFGGFISQLDVACPDPCSR